ncbi:riboflavin biosynthesis protein RibF [uncultured Bacteroides sp.]|uniref:riboflavin biosynthesis protein RibF n=1 Tax=uncultured Bacteroides sp. TaxID=162156 RepID=UPI0025FEF501|nr:riboflavin biosynthesis protein RibF [uncultured Bacteroides sp.]
MQIIHDISPLTPEPCVATIGFFDGVHTGHRYLFRQVKEIASAQNLRSALVTFPVHPRKVMKADYRPELLTTPEEKTALLAELGADYCLMLDFTPDISRLTAREFMRQVLKERFQVKCLVIGYDHRFGHNRSEGFEDYVRYGKEIGMEVIRAKAYAGSIGTENGEPATVSSSLIRKLLQHGKADMAARCLGYDYFLDGTVVGGYQVGRKIGFPTANLNINAPDKLIPTDGVYAVWVTLDGKTYMGMLNIGVRPTIGNGSNRTIEVNILHFHSDIYDKRIRLTFVKQTRPELKFSSIDELVAQLHKDAEETEAILLAKGADCLQPQEQLREREKNEMNKIITTT